MRIVTEQELVDSLRKECNQVKARLWIASPYIGNLKAVHKILGSKWLTNPQISVRLLTDVKELSRLSYETIEAFVQRGKVKEIRGLHAKIYIIDDNALITSANLTETAFSKRYEIGDFLSPSESIHLIEVYERWWNEVAIDIPIDWFERFSLDKNKRKIREEIEGETLPKLWLLPKAPQIPNINKVQYFLDYEYFRAQYDDFASKYSTIQRISPELPLYLETDGFLDFLFHHGGQPSFKYRKYSGKPLLPPRELNAEQRLEEIQRYAQLFKQWVEEGEDITWRQQASKLIGKKLEKNSIKNLQWDEVKEVVEQLNCMKAQPRNKVRFLNNNGMDKIRAAWSDLLYGNDELQIRMTRCKNALNFFGSSSVQELLGFFNPDIYPLRNSNCNAGLRFFGYDVAID